MCSIIAQTAGTTSTSSMVVQMASINFCKVGYYNSAIGTCSPIVDTIKQTPNTGSTILNSLVAGADYLTVNAAGGLTGVHCKTGYIAIT